MIKFDEIIKNKEYRERLIKYFRLPMRLSVSEEKFKSDLNFMKQTNKENYDEMVKLTENDFNNEVCKQKTKEPDFTMEYILEPIVDEFESNSKWREFAKEDYSDVLKDYKGITNPHQFYTKENDGKLLLSIDLVSANWQSLQSIIGFKESYEELIIKHTDNLIPPISKTVRTKITGLLNAKKIMDYNKKMLMNIKDDVLKEIHSLSNVNLIGKEPFAFYADEFIMELSKEEFDKVISLNFDEVEKQIYNKTNVAIHFVPFELIWLDLDKSCIKKYKNGKYDILNLSKDILLIINKVNNNFEIKDIDFEKIKHNKELLMKDIKRVVTKINNN